MRALALIAVFAAGCSIPPVAVFRPGLDQARFTGVNFRPDGKTLFSSNLLSVQNNLAAGSPARITMYTKDAIHLLINESEFTMLPAGGTHFPTDDTGVDRFINKYFVDRCEDLKIEKIEPELKYKVIGGLPMIGMTKEQVYLCIGPPFKIDKGTLTVALPREAILASDRWIYAYDKIVVVPRLVEFHFAQGRLEKQVP